VSAPRLMTEREAREYLRGCNPASVSPPTRIGRMVRWDRVALDRRLNELSGIQEPQAREDDADAAFREWKSRHG
jgi:hypothetical protein